MEVHYVYVVADGEMFLSCGEDVLLSLGKGYAGYGSYRDKSAFETRKALGPLPRGRWLVGFGINHPRLGPQAIALQPEDVPNLSGLSLIHI